MKYERLFSFFILALVFLCNGCGKQTASDETKTSTTEVLTSSGHTSDQKEVKNLDTPSLQKQHPTVPTAGTRSLANLLLTAKQPVGHTMYVWGGGWNEADTGAGVEATTIGVSSRWAEFEAAQTSAYDYNTTRYQIHDGLDCSGYIGWIIYNVFQTTNGQTGYVQKAGTMAQSFASNGWGTYIPAAQVSDWQPGDIMSMDGHVWLSLGMCEDNSVLLMHASPPGVRICGVRNPDGSTDNQAIALATQYMKEYYPDWYNRFPECSVDAGYLTKSSQMRWNRDTLSDEEELSLADAQYILERLYHQTS